MLCSNVVVFSCYTKIEVWNYLAASQLKYFKKAFCFLWSPKCRSGSPSCHLLLCFCSKLQTCLLLRLRTVPGRWRTTICCCRSTTTNSDPYFIIFPLDNNNNELYLYGAFLDTKGRLTETKQLNTIKRIKH